MRKGTENAHTAAVLAPSLVVRLVIGSAPELSICRSLLPARVAGPRRGEPVPGRGRPPPCPASRRADPAARPGRGWRARRQVLARGGAGPQSRPTPQAAILRAGSARRRTGIEPADGAARRPPVLKTRGHRPSGCLRDRRTRAQAAPPAGGRARPARVAEGRVRAGDYL